MKKLPIHVKIVIGLVLGIVWAFLSSFMGWNEFTIRWIDPFGMIFIRLLKFIAVPLVLFSIIGGVSGLRDVSKLGRLGWKTLLAYMTTTLLAVGIGLTLVNIVKPGTHIDDEQRIKNRLSYEVWLQENDIGATQDGLNFLSDPKYAAYLSEAQAAEQVTSPKLDLEKKMKTVAVQKESSPLKFIVEMVPDNIFASLSG
ncbi:cation:dicarboxylase symporter family transporter, partial [Cyclobacteriaceae bacterium]|nr:cation:dicarboxylase symporter family transporter [Cyclobacteriaceae bacterium]